MWPIDFRGIPRPQRGLIHIQRAADLALLRGRDDLDQRDDDRAAPKRPPQRVQKIRRTPMGSPVTDALARIR